MNFSHSEENYLKTIFHLSVNEEPVATNAIAEELNTRPASVSDMLKKLANKEAIHYIKYRGVTLTEEGKAAALWIIRKHRLWEVFLLEKLKFNWDEVHEVAEQLEHIKSRRMIERLDEFLGFPKYDPHGDPIPDNSGNFTEMSAMQLSEASIQEDHKVISVSDSSSEFLQYLDKVGIGIGSQLKVLDKIAFDESLEVSINNREKRLLTKKVAENILVAKKEDD
ncbi:metal-dependent transcriptional regulator [Rapidithrix thailandica]|uniref:Transcriptional regulator MntR n=1 Tax=Rapidithrix thailandica TaxID=413964 RepID=A0AAW9S7E6_9BACT